MAIDCPQAAEEAFEERLSGVGDPCGGNQLKLRAG